jgi:hypothetical protein
MPVFLSKNIIYTYLLTFFPVLSIISWGNVNSNNFDLGTTNYLLTHLLPTAVISYVIAFLATDRLDECYNYTLPKVLSSFVLYALTLLLFSDIVLQLGFTSIFETLQLAGVANAQMVAAKFYSFQLTVGLILLVVYYSVATYVFNEKSFMELLSKNGGAKQKGSRRERVSRKSRTKRELV